MAAPASLSAQSEQDDQVARYHFQRGQSAYDRGDFQEAADEFKTAYELSERPALLMNIYLAYRNVPDIPKALEALKAYLATASDIPNRPQLEERVARMEQSLTPQDEEPDDVAPTTEEPIADAPTESEGRSTMNVVGPIALGALGVGGLTAMIIGATGSGCVTRDAADVCTEERSPNVGAVAAYGAVGAAAIAGAIVWWVLGGKKKTGTETTQVAISPLGVDVRMAF